MRLQRQRPRGRGQAGVTLVELMVTVVILSIAMGAVFAMGSAMMNGYRDHRRISSVEHAARSSLDFMTANLRNASPAVPRGELEDLVGCGGIGGIRVTNSTTGPDQLEVIHAVGGVVTSVRQNFTQADSSMQVYDASGILPGDYVIVSNLEQGHILEVTDVQPSGGEYILTFSGSPSGLCGGATTFPTAGYTPGDILVRARASHFYIDSSAAVGNFPHLMLDPDGGGPATPEPLAAGIEDLQIAVGVDADGDGQVFENGTTTDEWHYNAAGDLDPPLITVTPPRALRITVVSRTETEQSTLGRFLRPPVEDHAGASTADPFRRRVLTTTVEIRNLEGSP